MHPSNTKVFNNQIFESWLDKKSDEILSKVDREKISTEEMIILILKAQTNHFFHMDQEMKGEIQSVRTELKNEIQEVRDELKNEIKEVRTESYAIRNELKSDIRNLDQKFETRFMWMIGLMAAGFSGLYIKLFFIN